MLKFGLLIMMARCIKRDICGISSTHCPYCFKWYFYWFLIYGCYILVHLFIWYFFMRIVQVQEKKVKKISEMNVDPSKAVGNGGVASSSNSSIGKQYLANGGDKSHNLPSNDLSISPGGFPSLRLPVVILVKQVFFFSSVNWLCFWNK